MRQRSMKCSWEAARSVVVLPDHFVANSAGVKVLPMGDGVRVNVQVVAIVEPVFTHSNPVSDSRRACGLGAGPAKELQEALRGPIRRRWRDGSQEDVVATSHSAS